MKQFYKYRMVFIFSLCAFILTGYWAYSKKAYKKTDGFKLSRIQFDYPYHPNWETNDSESKKEKVRQILGKKYRYLSKGARSYAFVSDDGQYVLKFFKYRYHIPHWTVRYLPPVQPFEYFRQKKAKKVSLETVLTGYSNAYQLDPEGTGLLHIHLNPSEEQYPTITVEDKIGETHVIDLDRTRFVLQHKTIELSSLLDDLLQKEELEVAKQRMGQTLDLYLGHFDKGLYDLGTGFVRNNGFLGERPVHFDVGKLTLDQRVRNKAFQQEVLGRLLDNADKWLADNHPPYRKEIMDYLQEKTGIE